MNSIVGQPCILIEVYIVIFPIGKYLEFANSHATLKVYTALGLDYLNGYQNVYASLQSLSVRVLSLNRDEYLYFKGLNCMDDDYDATLMEPVSLPTNVKGGLGFVGLCAGTQITMDFPK